MTKELQRGVFYSPCAFGSYGTTQELCERTTRVPGHNKRCAEAKCRCPLRACRVCVTLPGEPQKVHDPETGLCKLHKESEDGRKPATKPMVRTRQPRWAQTIANHGKKLPVPSASPANRPSPSRVARVPAAALPVRRDPDREVSVTVVKPAAARGLPRRRGRVKKPAHRDLDGWYHPQKEMAGYMKFFDPETGEVVQRGVLEALALVRRMHLEDNLTRAEIAKRLQVSRIQVMNFEKLELLISDVRDMLSVELPAGSRIGFAAAVAIADLREDLQAEVADRHIAGKCQTKEIRALLREPGNRRSDERPTGWHQERPSGSGRREPISKLEVRAKRIATIVSEIDQAYADLKEAGSVSDSATAMLKKFGEALRPSAETLSRIVEEIDKK